MASNSQTPSLPLPLLLLLSLSFLAAPSHANLAQLGEHCMCERVEPCICGNSANMNGCCNLGAGECDEFCDPSPLSTADAAELCGPSADQRVSSSPECQTAMATPTEDNLDMVRSLVGRLHREEEVQVVQATSDEWVIRVDRFIGEGLVNGKDHPSYHGEYKTLQEAQHTMATAVTLPAIDYFSWCRPDSRKPGLRAAGFAFSFDEAAKAGGREDPAKWPEHADCVSGYRLRATPGYQPALYSALWQSGDADGLARLWSRANINHYGDGDTDDNSKNNEQRDQLEATLGRLLREMMDTVKAPVSTPASSSSPSASSSSDRKCRQVCENHEPPTDASGLLGSYAKPAESCEAIMKSGGIRQESGVFWINTYDMMAPSSSSSSGGSGGTTAGVGGPFKVWCDLDQARGGGGWTLLLRSGGNGDEFQFDSPHWTTPTTLNEQLLSVDTTSDAKYDTFNRLRAREFMVVWPDIEAVGNRPASAWQTGPLHNTTALDFFQQTEILSRYPRQQPWWDRHWNSWQDGGTPAMYGVGFESRSTKVRWGYAFQEGTQWDTQVGDAVGGIGLATGTAGGLSGGDSCGEPAAAKGLRAPMGAAPPGRGRGFLLFGRTRASDAAAVEAAAAQQQQQRDQDRQQQQAALDATERAAAEAEASQYKDCNGHLTCVACAEVDGCAWCLGQRICVDDKPWICHGEEYHVSHPLGHPVPGKPGKGRCPTEAEIEADRVKREERAARLAKQKEEDEKRDAERARRRAQRLAQQAAEAKDGEAGGAAAAAAAADEDPALAEARKRAREKRRQTAEEELERIRRDETEGANDDQGKTTGGGGGNKNKKKQDEEEDDFEHVEELRRRAREAEEESGSTRPYEVLGIPFDAKQSVIRKVYRRLSLRFHPDKNPGHPEAVMVFADIVAAYEVVGTPDKRAMFDEASGGGGSYEDFDAKYEQGNFKFDSDLYSGDRLITTLTEKLWEKRLSGESIWLIECYAAWCPACQNFVPHWRDTAKLIASTDIEIGAVNCEKHHTICGHWFDISSYPTVVMINREHGMVQRYPKGRDRTPEQIKEWSEAIASEWRYLMAMSNVTMLHNAEADFKDVVFNSTDFWVVMFSDGLVCSQCRTAKTNMMRLSAGLRGMPVRVGIVDCEQPRNKAYCYEHHDLPPPPHRPQVRAWSSGPKREDDKGEQLYNVNMLEPHVALRLIEKVVRMSLKNQLDEDALKAVAKGAAGAFQDERDEEDDPPPPPPPPPPGGMHWDGPEQRHQALPWAGMSRPNGLPALTRG